MAMQTLEQLPSSFEEATSLGLVEGDQLDVKGQKYTLTPEGTFAPVPVTDQGTEPLIVTRDMAADQIFSDQNDLQKELNLLSVQAGGVVDLGSGGKYQKNADGSFTPIPITETKPAAPVAPAPTGGAAPGYDPQAFAGTPEQQAAYRKSHGLDDQGRPIAGAIVNTGKSVVEDPLQMFASSNADKTMKNLQDMTSALVKSMDATTAAMVQSIKSSYDSMIEEMRDLNTRSLEIKRVIGIRQGRSRYAPDIEVDALASEAQEGLARVEELQTKKVQAINLATAQNNEKKFDLLFKTMQEVREINKEQRQAIADAQKIAIDREKLILDQSKEIRERIKADLENSQKLGDVLGYVALEQTVGIDDLEKKSDIIKSIASQYGLDPAFLESSVAKLDAERKKYPAGDVGLFQMSNDLRRKNGLPVFASFEEWNKERMLTDEGIKSQFRIAEEGAKSQFRMQEDKAKAAISGTEGLPASPLSDAFRFVAVGMSENERKAVTSDIKRLIESGQDEQAREYIKRLALEKLPTEQKNKALGRFTATDALKKVEIALDQYVAKGGSTGILTGTEEAIKNKIGDTKDPELAKIANNILLAIIAYRNAVSGAAFTESEQKQYNQVFPSIGKVPELNKAKIDSLIGTFESNNESVLQAYIGAGNYKKVFGGEQAQGGDEMELDGKVYVKGADGLYYPK